MRGLTKAIYTAYLIGPGSRQLRARYRWLRQWKDASPPWRQEQRSRAFVELFRFAFDFVPFYRHLYDEHGITRSAVQSIDDLAKLPTVTRDMLASSPLRTRASRWSTPLQGPASTSGSSGRPLPVSRSMDCLLRQGAQLYRHLDVWGLHGRRKVQFCLYNEDPTLAINLPYSAPLSVFNRSHSIHFAEPIENVFAILQRNNPDVLVTYASKAEEICDWAIQHRTVYSKPIAFSVGAEALTPPAVERFHRAFPEGQIYSVYACVEMGLIAVECPCHAGLHVNDWSIVLEKGQEYDGFEGERAFVPIYTNLWNRGTPFIRYAGIDDLIVTDQAACDCGSGNQVIKKLQGRVAEMLHSPTTANVPVSAMVSAHADLKGVKRFQYVQKDRGSLVLRYVPCPGANHEEITAAARCEVEKLLGDRIRFECEAVKEIQRKPGSPKVRMLVTS